MIANCIKSINDTLTVSKIVYTVDVGEQKDSIKEENLDSSFKREANSSKTRHMDLSAQTSAKYDLVHEIAQRTHLTRKTVVKILVGTKGKLSYFRDNPEEFITKFCALIEEEKASVIVSHISYNQLKERFSSDIFNVKHANFDSEKAFKSSKAIQDYVIVDGYAKDGDSNEMSFAKKLENASEVKVYAKLPRSFYIPTPMGNYTPDWAIVYEKGPEKGVYFIAETKGSLDSLSLRKIEAAKISCADTLYNKRPSKVTYGKIHDYEDFYQAMDAYFDSVGAKR